MAMTYFQQYVVEGPKGRVVISKETHRCSDRVEKPWTAVHEALGAWEIEITEKSDADREAKYFMPLTGLPYDELFELFNTRI